MIQIGARFNDRFEIESLAGRGGMGVVYRAIDHQTKAPVAVKLLTACGPSALQRFARESYILASLQHPNIVRHIAHGELEDGALFLVMEWLDGEDLSQRLKRGALCVEESLVLIHAVANALAEAHSRGIVHRDIKPSNIFLPKGHLGALKVLDFGIARPAEADLEMTRTGMILGTPGYMSPEQAVRGAKGLGPSADIFALGCVLFECLAGRPTFMGENILAVLSKVLLEEPPPLRSLRADVPEALEALTALSL